MRAMGKRELGELEVGELVTSLLISEVCSIPIDNPDIPLLNAIITVGFIVCVEIILSVAKNKSPKLRTLIDGKPSYIIYKGRLNPESLRQNRISIDEFLFQMRQNGIGSLDEVDYCIIESNGKVSMLKRGDGGGLGHLLIADGVVLWQNLKPLGYDEVWLRRAIGNASFSDIFIFSVNDEGASYLVRKPRESK